MVKSQYYCTKMQNYTVFVYKSINNGIQSQQEYDKGLLMTYQLTKELVIRKIAGEYVAVPVGETAITLNGLIALTESGQLLFKKLQEGCEFEDLVQVLLDEYEVTEEQAEKDVQNFIAKMETMKLL